MTILIEPNKPGSLWLRAMFRFYCRQYECGYVYSGNGLCEATGHDKHKAHYAYELAHARLMIACINAIAKNDLKHNSHIVHKTIRQFVKDLYRGSSVQAD